MFIRLRMLVRSAVGSAPDSSVRSPGFDTQSCHILLFPLPLIQEGQLLVISYTGESTNVCVFSTRLVNRLGGISLPRNTVVWLTDRPDMTIAVYRGNNNNKSMLV